MVNKNFSQDWLVSFPEQEVWQRLEFIILQLVNGLKLLRKLPIQETEVVLDLGCGTGRLTNNIAKRVINGKVIGIDPDEERIKIAMAEGTGDSINLQFMIASDQSFPQNQYDHVVSTDVIYSLD